MKLLREGRGLRLSISCRTPPTHPIEDTIFAAILPGCGPASVNMMDRGSPSHWQSVEAALKVTTTEAPAEDSELPLKLRVGVLTYRSLRRSPEVPFRNPPGSNSRRGLEEGAETRRM